MGILKNGFSGGLTFENCSVLQCVAVCCSVLQCVAVCCSVLQYLTYKNGFSGGLTFENFT